MAGGALRRSDGGLVGELTTHFFEQFKVDVAIIGCWMRTEISDYDLAEVRVLNHHPAGPPQFSGLRSFETQPVRAGAPGLAA